MTPGVDSPAITPSPATAMPAAHAAPIGTPDLQAVPARGFDFRHLWHLVLEKIWIVVFCVLAGLFLAFGYLARTPKIYQGHVTLEVDIAEQSLVPTDDAPTRVRSMFLASQEAMRTIEQNLVNRTLMARVIRAEGLADDNGQALVGGGKAGAPAPKPRSTPAAADDSKELSFTPLEEGLAGALSGM